MKKAAVLGMVLVSWFGLAQAFGAEEFKVTRVIHPVVADLPAPKVVAAFGAGVMAVSSSSDQAAEHVAQGISRLNTSWDFEAYRHFCAAAKLDPDCLMAYWGIAISLAGSEHEFFDQRQAAVDRMLDLLEAVEPGENDRWSDLERGYAQGVGLLLTEGLRSAGKFYEGLSEKYPADIQSKLFSLFFLRDGFDEYGKPLVGQTRANEGLLAILAQHPENLSVMSFWVSSQAEAPLGGAFLRNEVLPTARKLARLHPEYAPFQLMLTHVEARCGNADLGIEAADKAVGLFEAYMKAEGVAWYDCEGWLRCKVYLVNLYQTKGKHAEAVAVAEELAKMPIVKERVFSRGAGLMLWEGRTAGARLMMGRMDEESLKKGLEMLSALKEGQWHKEQSFAIYYRDCLAFDLGVRRTTLAGKTKEANVLFQGFIERARSLGEKQPMAAQTSSYGSWKRATNTLAIVTSELRGMLSGISDSPATRASASTWYSSAMEMQGRPTNLLPPSIDYPMELRLGDFYFALGEVEKAGKIYREGLEIRPNHLKTLEGFLKALEKLGKTESAAIIAKRIEVVSQ